MLPRFVVSLAVLTTAALLITGCTAGAGASGSAAIPTPAGALKLDSAILPAAAPRPTSSKGNATDALADEADTLARAAAGTGDGAIAALRTALVMSGVDLTDVGGKVTDVGDSPKSGIRVPLGEAAAVVGSNTFEHGLTVEEIGDALAPLISKKYGTKLDPRLLSVAILGDTRSQEAGTNYHSSFADTAQFHSEFIAELGRNATPAVDLDTAGIDTRLTGMQTWMLLIGMAGGLAEAAKIFHDGATSLPVAPGALIVHAGDPNKGGCRPDDTTGKIQDWAAIGFGAAATGVPMTEWGGMAGKFVPAGGEANPSKVFDGSDMVSWLNIVLALAHSLVEGLSFHATLSMVPEPLVRTTSQSDYGAESKITVHATFNIPNGQWANCLRTAANVAGADGSVPNHGPIKQASVQWQIDNESSGVTDNPVVFTGGTKSAGFVESITDDSGDGKITLQGVKQRSKLPPQPAPYLRKVGVWASLQLKSSTLYGDLTEAISTVFGGAAIPASIAASLIDRMHSFGVHHVFQVQDWQKDFKVDSIVDLNAGVYNDVGQFPLVTGIKCDGLKGDWDLDVGGEPFSFTLDADGHGTTTTDGLGGPVSITYDPGPPSKIHFQSDAIEQSFTVISGDFCK